MVNKRLIWILVLFSLVLLPNVFAIEKFFEQTDNDGTYVFHPSTGVPGNCVLWNTSEISVNNIRNVTLEVMTHFNNNGGGKCWVALKNWTNGDLIANSTPIDCNSMLDSVYFNYTINTSKASLVLDTTYSLTPNYNYSICFEKSDYTVPTIVGRRKAVGTVQATLYDRETSTHYNYEIQGRIYGYNDTYSPISSGSIQVTLLSPVNNTINNTNSWNFYFSLNYSNQSIYNCSLFLNNRINKTSKQYIDDGIPIWNGTWSFNQTIEGDGNYNWTIGCNNGTNYIYPTNNWTFTKDVINPIIYTTFINNSNYYQNNISFLVNLTDDNLYRVNITIDNKDQYYNDTLTGYTNWLYNFSKSTSNLSVGKHTLKIEAADGHTSKEIASYQINKGLLDNSLNFRTSSSYISIIPQEIDLFANFNYQKQTDRYTFDYVPSKAISGVYSFVVASDKKIQIINNDKTQYKTWLISGNNWIDFYLPNMPSITPKITRLSDRRVQVDIDLSSTDTSRLSSLSFNSIGDLNIISSTFDFYVGNYSVIYSSPILESTSTIHYLNITYNSSYIQDINASLNYNGTWYNADTKSISTTNILFSKTISVGLIGLTVTNNTFYWGLNISNMSGAKNYYNTSILNQTVEYINVYNCSYNNESQVLNFTYLKESDGSSVLANTSGLITIWSNPSYKKTFSLKYNQDYNSTFCLYPSSQNLTADIQFAFTSSGYVDENYISNNIGLNKTNHLTQNIFFAESTATTAITITVYDSTSNAVAGYSIEAWKYDLATNSYTLLDTQKTDTNGQVITNLITGNNEYVFKVKDITGNLVYTSEKMKLYTTSYVFRLPATSEKSDTTFRISQFGCPLAFTNYTSLLTATYNDIGNLGTNYYLYLSLSNVTNNTIISSTSSTFSATTLSLTVPTTNNYYMASFYIDYVGDGLKHPVCSIAIDRRSDAQTLGLVDSLLMSAIFIGTLALIGITIGAEIALILLLVGFVALMSMGLISLGAGYGLGGLIVVILIYIYRLYKRGY